MWVQNKKSILGAAVLAAVSSLPVTPVAIAQEGVLEEVVVTEKAHEPCRTWVLR